MPKVFFENIHTKNRYEVVGRDTEAGTVTLVGRHNAPFTVKYSKDSFEEMGYRPVSEEAQESPPAPPAPPPPAASAVPPPPVSQPASA